MTEKYNGYTNYETWIVNLWLSNDQGFYDMVRDQIEDMIDNYDLDEKPDYRTVHDDFKFNLSDWLKEWISELQHEALQDHFGVFSDLLGATLDKVNWDEIAVCWLEEYSDRISALGKDDLEGE